MAKYPYRHTLDISNDTDFDARGRAIIDAAFAVATVAHAQQSREKVDPHWMYIAHPILVFDLMRAIGEKDPITLAGALLHDSLEKDSKYHGDAQELRKALWGRINNIPIELASFDDVRQILLLVGEVTNPAAYGEGKEMYQVDRARTMSLAAKKIKIADQTASLICNLTMENNPQKFSRQQEMGFTQKATSLVSAIVRSAEKTSEEDDFRSYKEIQQEVDAIRPYHHLFGRVLRRAMPLLKESDIEKRNKLRDEFNYDGALTSRSAVSILPVETSVADTVELEGPEIDGVRGGVARVHIDQSGRVCSFVMRTAPSGGPQHWVNRIQQDIVELLRKRSHMTSETLQLGESLDMPMEDGTFGRIYRLSAHPLLFASAAREAGRQLSLDAGLSSDQAGAVSQHGIDLIQEACNALEEKKRTNWGGQVQAGRNLGKRWASSLG